MLPFAPSGDSEGGEENNDDDHVARAGELELWAGDSHCRLHWPNPEDGCLGTSTGGLVKSSVESLQEIPSRESRGNPK